MKPSQAREEAQLFGWSRSGLSGPCLDEVSLVAYVRDGQILDFVFRDNKISALPLLGNNDRAVF